MQNIPTTDPNYAATLEGVSDKYDTAFENIGNAIGLYQTLSDAWDAQKMIDGIRQLDNKVTADISTQEAAQQAALGKLDIAQSNLSGCQSLHPNSGGNSST